eukprot:236802_1
MGEPCKILRQSLNCGESTPILFWTDCNDSDQPRSLNDSADREKSPSYVEVRMAGNHTRLLKPRKRSSGPDDPSRDVLNGHQDNSDAESGEEQWTWSRVLYLPSSIGDGFSDLSDLVCVSTHKLDKSKKLYFWTHYDTDIRTGVTTINLTPIYVVSNFTSEPIEAIFLDGHKN